MTTPVPAPLATASPRYRAIVDVEAEVAAIRRDPPRLRLSLRRTLVAVGAAGALAACASWLSASRSVARGDLPSLRALDQPLRRYDSSQPGGLPMPSKSSQYDGIDDQRDFTIDQNADFTHIFAVGDWGAPLPGHQTFGCHGWDCNAQVQVARAMIDRSKWAWPQYVLNVGDAFYLGGIMMSCNAPPGAAWGKASGDFSAGWQSIYENVAGVPWISTLGNHDYGGWQFDQGWPQQIGYSFVNHNWIMPARYFTRKVQHKNWVAEYFVIDSNVFDAKAPAEEASHNICSQQHNPGDAQCSANDGMANVWACKDWFWSSYKVQKAWLEQKVQESTARWKIVVTHFPCGYDGSFYKGLYERYGLDLLVTGHRHQQELWWKGTSSRYIQNFVRANDIGELPCFVTGGGGGISSEFFPNADYGRDLLTYGFFDITMARDWMNIELIDVHNVIRGNITIHPHGFRGRWVEEPFLPTTTTTTTTTTTSSTTTATTTTSTTSTTNTTTTTTTTETTTTTWGPGLPIPEWKPPPLPPMPAPWTPPPLPPMVLPVYTPPTLPPMPTLPPWTPPTMPPWTPPTLPPTPVYTPPTPPAAPERAEAAKKAAEAAVAAAEAAAEEAAKKAAEERAEERAEKAAEESAEAATEEAAKKAAEERAKKAAEERAEKAARERAEERAEEVAEESRTEAREAAFQAAVADVVAEAEAQVSGGGAADGTVWVKK